MFLCMCECVLTVSCPAETTSLWDSTSGTASGLACSLVLPDVLSGIAVSLIGCEPSSISSNRSSRKLSSTLGHSNVSVTLSSLGKSTVDFGWPKILPPK